MYYLVNIKFVFFEKGTKFDEISILLLTNKFVFFVSRYSFEHQSGSQSWNFIHWDQTNPSKVYLFLDADKFVLSFLLISNKNQLCCISRLNSSQMGLRGRHSNCLSNLLKVQNWEGNTEKQIYWSKEKWRFRQKTQTLKLSLC